MGIASANGLVSFNQPGASAEKKIEFLNDLAALVDKGFSIDMDLSFVLGKAYHQFADQIKSETGVDPRPYDEIFWSAK